MPTTELIELECGTCGVWHAIPKKLHETMKAEGGFWFCPNGHQRGWGTGTLQAERDRLKQKVAEISDEILEARRQKEAETVARVAAERKLIQARRRATAGVCPCCTRTFSNVQRHMKSKHPNVVPLSQKEIG